MARYEELWCERGQHKYDWPVKRGRKPKSCAAHPAEPGEARAAPVAENLAPIIRRTLDNQGVRGTTCTCDILPTMSRKELIALGAGCKAPAYVCSVLDAVRRAIGYDPNT
jgi:hypothetical protein